jgi:quercetin dioxygenase-like cupin family protein
MVEDFASYCYFLAKGTRIPDHRAPGPLTLNVLSGSVIFPAGDRTERVGPGELVVLEAAIEHDVEAEEETACLLTLGCRLGQATTVMRIRES